MSTVDPNQRFLETLQGPGLELFVVSVVGGILSLIVVTLRAAFRLHRKSFGLDDALMLGGLAVYLVDVALACVGAYSGLGTRNKDLSPIMMVESMKYLMIWMMLYVAGLCLVKTSICVTTLRIAVTMPKLRIAVYVLLGLTVATFITTFTGILLLCRPVEANWDPTIVMEGRGSCSSVAQMLGLSYTSTISTITTDLACAILPAIILWQTQMKLSTKIMVATVLSFGSLASISTMIRTPYIDYYNRPTDDLAYYISYIPLWSNVETAVGLIAGSLPALRQFFVMSKSARSTNQGTGGSRSFQKGSSTLVTIGGTSSKDRKAMNSNFELDDVEQSSRWTRLDEDNSDKESTVPIHGVRVDREFEVESVKRG